MERVPTKKRGEPQHTFYEFGLQGVNEWVIKKFRQQLFRIRRYGSPHQGDALAKGWAPQRE